MFIRNFEIPGHQEQVSVEQFVQIAMKTGNLGRCLMALKKATKEELTKLTILLPESNNVRFAAKDRLENHF